MIPKVIHYIWVGDKALTPLAEKCISSWRSHLLDYEFRFWQEANMPSHVMDHPYVQTMYQKKKWAFVADYIRFWALYREGGIYLDTDTEVIKSLNPLLEHDVFFGRTKDGFVAAGVIGAVPGHQVIKDILNIYDQDTDFNTDRTSPRTVSTVLAHNHYHDVVIYDYQYFNPCDEGEECNQDKLDRAYTINHWAESWVPFAKLRKILRRLGIIRLLKSFYVPKT